MVSLIFDNPLFLWYLISVPLLVITHFFLLRHTRKKAMKFANFDALKRVTGNYFITKNVTVLVLRVATLTLLILAAAGTEFRYEGQRNDNDFVLAIDTSASMSAEDIEPTRLEAAKEEAIRFVDSLHSEGKIGLVSFGGVALVETTITDSKREVKTQISELTIQETGGTNIGGAIVTGTNLMLENENRGRVLVLLSDGSNTAGPFIDRSITAAIDYATEHRVRIHTIGFGTNTGPIGYLAEFYNISATFDETNLERMSNLTGGKFFRARDQIALRNSYASISQESEEATLSIDLRYALLFAAIVLLFVEWGLINTRFRKVP